MARGDEDDPPTKVGFPVVDIATGMLGAMSVLAALHRRDVTGTGTRIDTSLAQAALQLMRPMVARVLTTERDDPRPGNRGFSGSPGAATFRCADDWLAVAANTRHQFGVLCDLLGLPGVADDPILVRQASDDGATNVLPVNSTELRRRLEEAFARHDAVAIETRLNEAGVPAARVRRIGEFLHEARSGRHVELGLQRQQTDSGAFLQMDIGVASLGLPATAPAPILGADTAEILRRAGLSPEEIGALALDGAIRIAG
jgi:crotonobetainyl-CoA:carnitine CoA-transferase CaiB-like acyl-CoA transferase